MMMAGNGRPQWTDEDMATAIEMWRKGASASEIGDVVHRSRNSVLGKLHRKKVARMPGGPRPARDPTAKPTDVRRAAPKKRVFTPPKPQAVPTSPKPLPGPTDGILQVDRADGMCCWPFAPGRCCGEPVEAVRKPYCAGHASVGRRASAAFAPKTYRWKR